MKRHKLWICLIFMLGIIFIPLFAGCQNKDEYIVLKTPISVNYKINQGSGRQIIFTEENPYASGYVFGISETDTDIESFSRFEVKETDVNGKIKNYLDVTNLFLNTKTYYFYAQYLGEGKYKDSNISEVKSTTIYDKYESPFLALNDATLSWSSIINADSYLVYATIDGNKELAFSTSGTSWAITNFVNQKIKSGLSSKIDFSVCVDSYKNHLRSAESNLVTYDAFLHLTVPQNLEVVESGDKKLLRWSEVPNCDNYTIRVNLINEFNVSLSNLTKNGSKLSYDVTHIIDELGDYQFAIKSNNTGNFVGTGYSSEITYTKTQKLDAPTEVKLIDYGSFVEVSWDKADLAIEYLLYFTDLKNGGSLKQFILNEDTGIQTSIIQNCLSLTYEQLGVSGFSQLKANNFLVKVQSKGYGYYETSEMSNKKVALKVDEEIESPIITDNATQKTIVWEPVQNASYYLVTISHNKDFETFTKEATNFNYSSALTKGGEYKIKCQAVSTDNKISGDSNVIIKNVSFALDAPVITEVKMEDDEFVINFEDAENAENYSLYVFNTLIKDDFNALNNNVSLLSVADYQQNGTLVFSLVANAHDYFSSSPKSEGYEIELELSTPHITILDNILSWEPILFATSYNLILDDVQYNLNDISTSIDLTEYVPANTARQVRVQATNAYLKDSDISNMEYFNTAVEHTGFTDQYFYFGQTYDFYITSEKEFGDFLEYIFLNFIETPVSVYVDYKNSVTISSKITSAKKQITGTRNYDISVSCESSEYYGKTTLTFNHAEKSDPSTTKLYSQYQYDMVYTVESQRQSDYQWACDNRLVSQKVWSTDGLLSAIQHKATPVFMETNSLAERIYNIAKALLIELIDDSMTDYQKALILHDYLAETITYDDWGLDNVNSNTYLGYFHYIESALLGSNLAVCDGYAKTYALLCEMEGIDCIVVHGTYRGGGHAWNKIFLDLNDDGVAECYAVDVTFDDLHVKQGSVTTEFLTHQFFLIPDSYFDRRVEDSNVTYPKAVSSEKFYSYHKPYGFSLKIDSDATLNGFVSFMQNNEEHINLELLVHSSYISSNKIGGYTYSAKIGYSPNSNYYLVYLHT